MAELFLQISVSLDGFIEHANHDIRAEDVPRLKRS